MNRNAAVSRMLWKELVGQLPIWAMLLLMTVGLLAITWLFGTNQSKETFAMIAGSFAGIYAVACAVTLFATEKENRTFEFLQNLPVSPRLLGTLKLTLGLLLVLVFVSIAGAIVYPLVSNWLQLVSRDFPLPIYVFAGFVLPVIELYLFTGICSLFVKRSITAAVLGIGLTGLVYLIVNLGSTPALSNDHYSWFAGLIGMWPVRVGVCLVMLIANVAIASNWLSVSFGSRQRVLTDRMAIRSRKWRWPATMHVLFWQSFRDIIRQVPLIAVVLSIAPIVVVIFPAVVASSNDIRDMEDLFGMVLFAFPIGMAVAASWTFSSDQIHKRKSFFVQQFETPRLIWLIRNLVWLITSFIILAVILFFGSLLLAWWAEENVFMIWAAFLLPSNTVGYAIDTGIMFTLPTQVTQMITALLLAFAIGQFYSMLFRRAILAMVLAGVTAVGTYFWIRETIFLQLGIWWSVWPLIIAMLFATWWFAPVWMADQRRWTAFGKPILAACIPFVVIPLFVPMARLGQVPDTTVRQSTMDRANFLTSTTSIETAEAFHQALEDYVMPESVAKMLESDSSAPGSGFFGFDTWEQKLLDEFNSANEKCYNQMQAAAQSECCYPFIEDAIFGRQRSLELFKIYRVYGARAESALRQGNLEESFEQFKQMLTVMTHVTSYPVGSRVFDQLYDDVGRWTSHPLQTESLLIAALNWVDQPEHFAENPSDWYANYKFWDANRNHEQSETLVRWGFTIKPFYFQLPWERERARRLALILADRTESYPWAGSELESQIMYPVHRRYESGKHGVDSRALRATRSSAVTFDLFDRARRNYASPRYRFDKRLPWSPSNTYGHFRAWNLLKAKLYLVHFGVTENRYPESTGEIYQEWERRYSERVDMDNPSQTVIDKLQFANERFMFFDQLVFPVLIRGKGLDEDVFLKFEMYQYLYAGRKRAAGNPKTRNVKIFEQDQPFFLDFYFETAKSRSNTGQPFYSIQSNQRFSVADEDEPVSPYYKRYPNLFLLPKKAEE